MVAAPDLVNEVGMDGYTQLFQLRKKYEPFI